MSDWLDPLGRVLDGAKEPAIFFFRDDDAGWADDSLHRLLDLFERHGTPVDLAVIPQDLGDDLARYLRARLARGDLGLHQHGLAHVNHEPEARKCEFGLARRRGEQWNDIETGRARLETMLGPDLDPIFTPPWNRCTGVTVDCLESLGFRVLSRDATAAPIDIDGLTELPVCVDWLRRSKGVRIGRDDLGRLIAEAAAGPAAVGIMLHHAAMDESDWDDVDALLGLVAGHDKARCRLMRDIAGVAGFRAPVGAVSDGL